MSFQLRNILCEYSLSPPSAVDRLLFPNVRQQIPTFHIFGTTPAGKKACVHVHGVLPYLLLRIGAEFTPTLDQLMKDKIDCLIQRELTQNTEKVARGSTFVYKIEPVMGRSIYGYHEKEEQFAKIFFFNPIYRTKLLNALAKEVDEFPIMQPFEAHTPFILQFFIDNSIFGMDDIFFKHVQYRFSQQVDPKEFISDGLTIGDVIKSTSLLSPIVPITSCDIECDAMVNDIMNKDLHSANVHSCNSGLEYMWREEAARCAAQGHKFEDTFNNYTPRPYWKSNVESDLLRRLEKLAMSMGNGDHCVNPSPSLDETLASQCFSLGEEDELDVTTSWSADFKEYDVLNVAKETNDNESHEENDEITDTMSEEIFMTQIIDTSESDEKNKEITSPDIEDFFCEDELPPQRYDPSLSQSRWVTLDIDLPLSLREAAEAPKSSLSSGISVAFEDASFQPMPMNMSLDKTVILSNSSNGRESEAGSGLSEISGLSAASLELLVFTGLSVPDPQFDPLLGFSFCFISDVCCTSLPTQHVFVTTLPVQSVESLCCVPNELSLFEELENLVKGCNPDILFGYDTTRLSWGYVLKRAAAIGLIDFHQNISRYPRDMLFYYTSLFGQYDKQDT